MWFQWRASCSVTGVSRGRTALWKEAIARPSSISSLLQMLEEACARRAPGLQAMRRAALLD